MNVNLHIETKTGVEHEQENNISKITDIFSPPQSPKLKIRKGKPKGCDKNTILTYEFYKNEFLPTLNSKKKVFIYKQQLLKTLKHMNLNFDKSAKKPELQNILFSLYKKINSFDNPNIIYRLDTAKKQLRDRIKKRKLQIYGPGYIDKKLCKNQEDCFSMESIDDISDEFFFSVEDKYNSIFFFDIRTFKKLIDKNSDNPYNREPFTEESKKLYNMRCEYMIKNGISIIYPDEEEYINNLSPEEKIKNKLVDIFGEIDALNVIAGGTRLDWFLTLNIIQLKKLYKVLEDVWNYRAELSQAKKLEIVPENNMFPNSVNYVFNLTSKIQIQNIILNEMEKLVKSSPNEANRHTGAYYILISLTEISYQCATDLPWLIQY